MSQLFRTFAKEKGHTSQLKASVQRSIRGGRAVAGEAEAGHARRRRQLHCGAHCSQPALFMLQPKYVNSIPG